MSDLQACFSPLVLPVWTVLWLARLPLYLNVAWQRSHLYGLSLCTWSMCCFSASSSANLESHSLQKNVPFSARREIKGKVKRLKCLDHLSGEGEAQTHHSWSRSIRSGAPTCLLTGGSWRRGDRPPSAEATGSRRWSSWGGSGSVEDLLPSPNPRVNCRQKVSSVIIFHTRWASFLKVPEMVVKLERR